MIIKKSTTALLVFIVVLLLGVGVILINNRSERIVRDISNSPLAVTIKQKFSEFEDGAFFIKKRISNT